MKKLLIWLLGSKKCGHRFHMKEVLNTKIDPKCVYCNKPLSEL